MSADKKASRRHFLAGELAGMFAEVLDAAADQMAFLPQGHGPAVPADLVRVSRRAMAAVSEGRLDWLDPERRC